MTLGLRRWSSESRTHKARSASKLCVRVALVQERCGAYQLGGSNHFEPELPEFFGRSVHVSHFLLRDHDVEF